MINNKFKALRLHKHMGGPLGPDKNLSSFWQHKIPIALSKDILCLPELSTLGR